MNDYIGGMCWGYNGVLWVKRVLWSVGGRKGVEGVVGVFGIYIFSNKSIWEGQRRSRVSWIVLFDALLMPSPMARVRFL